MKKFVVFALMLMSGVVAKAQWTFTPEAGLNVTKYEDSETAKFGPRVGVAVEYQLPQSDLFSIRTGLYFLQRGRNDEYYGYYGNYYSSGYGNVYYGNGFYGEGEPNQTRYYPYSSETKKNYLQLPVMANFSWNICDKVRITAGVGPYIAYGVGGKSSTTMYVHIPEGNDSYFTSVQNPFSKREFRSTDGTIYTRSGDKRFDWGVTAMAGIEINRISVNVGYDMGLAKQYPGYAYQVSPQYHALSFSVGYSF
ncbi:MAG: PorT family protein [Tannerellaceae bacterium]|nr:PorT family protein [Tannerellaceae bacterium]